MNTWSSTADATLSVAAGSPFGAVPRKPADFPGLNGACGPSNSSSLVQLARRPELNYVPRHAQSSSKLHWASALGILALHV